MTFEKWLQTRGYFPIGIIISNYRINGFSEEDIDKSVEKIKQNYRYWCSSSGVEPIFQYNEIKK